VALKLTPAELAVVKNILQAHVPHYSVWAFGSRVTGKAAQFSDLDLVLLGDAAPEPQSILQLRDAFSVSALPFKVDVCVWADLDPNFRNIIKQAYYEIQTG
jgi:predicted nucleotidyltransferase